MRARRIRVKRAKTVPPGPAMGPRMVRAARKTVMVVKTKVRKWARGSLGGHTLGGGATGMFIAMLPIFW